MPPEIEEQQQEPTDFFIDDEGVGEVEGEYTEETVETDESTEYGEPEADDQPSPDDELRQRMEQQSQENRELQRRIIDLMEAQRPKPEPTEQGPDLRDILGKRFDEKTANNLAEALGEYEQVLASKFAQKDELNRFSGTLANLARNADEARVFDEFRRQGVPDEDIRESRKMIDQMVNNEGAYFPNAQVAMDAAYGRLRRQRARETAGKTTAARANKTADRAKADMGTQRGGAGVPALSRDEKQAAYEMDTADFLDWLDKKTGK